MHEYLFAKKKGSLIRSVLEQSEKFPTHDRLTSERLSKKSVDSLALSLYLEVAIDGECDLRIKRKGPTR